MSRKINMQSITRFFKKNRSFDSSAYWEERYIQGRNSGNGSYGRLAEFKAKIINDFVPLPQNLWVKGDKK